MRLDHSPLRDYPPIIIQKLAEISQADNCRMFLCGGAVRDWLLKKHSIDLDITVDGDGVQIGRRFAAALAAAFVLLDEREKVARVVWKEYVIDFSSFRERSTTIEEDLAKRDFTINAMGIALDKSKGVLQQPFDILDPTGGVKDLAKKIVRATSATVFRKDPLRLLRAYRFMGELGFTIDKQTAALIEEQASLVTQAAGERIAYELDRIMSVPTPSPVITEMAASALLWKLFPELKQGVGMKQPAGHHLDVFHHCLATLGAMEKLIHDPSSYFPNQALQLTNYLERGRRAVWLKWAAFFHDVGKPDAYQERDARITFYTHEHIGAKLFERIGDRLRWSNDDRKQVARFISLHMWPFHLNNEWRKAGVSPRACLRLVKAVGDELPGLFLLAMADSLAGQGEGKPVGVEQSLAALYDTVDKVYQESIKPVIEQPRLINGYDLQELFNLKPGPVFKQIFSELEQAQVAGDIKTKDQAVVWVDDFLSSRKEN